MKGGLLRQRIGKAVLVALIVLCIVGCDQTTKRIAETRWNDGTYRILLDGLLVIRYVENDGAFLGMGSALPKPLRTVALTVLPVLALAFLIPAFLRGKGPQGALVIGWALVAGGGVGNLIDRVARDGLVRDFLNFGIGSLRTGILNVADLAITAGCLLIAFQALRRRRGAA
jgi:signal peptidase II